MKLKTYILSCLLSVIVIDASAIVVFDPTNWVQNNINAYTAIKNEINSYQMRVTQLMQLKNELQNLRAMGNAGAGAMLQNLDREYSAVMKLKNNSEAFLQSLNLSNNYVEGIRRMINISDLTPKQWFERERKLVDMRNDNALKLMKDGEIVVDKLEDARKQRETILKDQDIDEGLRGTAMKTNALIGNLTSVLSTQIHYLKAVEDKKSRDETANVNERLVQKREVDDWIKEKAEMEKKAAEALKR